MYIPFLSMLLGINEYVLSFVKPGRERERGERERRREREEERGGERERGGGGGGGGEERERRRERRERRERGRGEEREEEREREGGRERGGERARQLFIALSKKINPHHTQIPLSLLYHAPSVLIKQLPILYPGLVNGTTIIVGHGHWRARGYIHT